MTQGDLFRDEAIDQVEDNADRKWTASAIEGVRFVAGLWETLTTDNVWAYMDNRHFITHDNRAMGAVMRKAQAEGWIEPTDQVVKSTRPVCHSRPIRVWKSKLI